MSRYRFQFWLARHPKTMVILSIVMGILVLALVAVSWYAFYLIIKGLLNG